MGAASGGRRGVLLVVVAHDAEDMEDGEDEGAADDPDGADARLDSDQRRAAPGP